VDEIEPLVIPDLILTRMKRGFRTVIVKMPVLWKDWWYEDLAKVSGATIIDSVAGLPIKMANISHLGTVENIVISKDTTFIDGIKDISEHTKLLEAEESDDAKLRLARLNTKTARYFVGAPSDSALSYRRLKVEDAISAAWQALQGGIVAGGGVALLSARPIGESVGAQILTVALERPFRQIAKNANLKECEVFFDGIHGVDSRTGESVDMFKAGITDPAPVVLNAVKNAISVAAAILTASSIITLPQVSQEKI